MLSPECCPEPEAFWYGWLCMFLVSHFASGISLASFFKPVFVVSIEADPTLGVPYGNDLQFS